MRRRLCIVTPTHWAARMGGSQYQVKVLIDYLLEHYDVEIFYLTTRQDPEFEPQGYRIVRFSEGDGLRRYGFFFDVQRLYAALARLKPHAIYQQVGCAHTGIAAYYARRNGCRMVWRVASDRNVLPSGGKWWQAHRVIERRLLDYGIRHADVIVAQTRAQQAELARRFDRADAAVIPNFHPSARDPAAKDARKQVVWIGNLKPLKNPHAFVRLARAFIGRGEVDFVMIGAAMDDSRWTHELMAAIRATPNLKYLGARSQDEVNAKLDRSHILINTSDYEGFSNTFIQAWMRRLPVVSLHVDPDALLSEQGLGLLSGDEAQLREDVARLLDAPAMCEGIGARSRAYALSRHAESNIDELARFLLLDPFDPLTEGGMADARA